jgi:putative transposase
VLRGPLERGHYFCIRYTERLAEAVNGLYKVEVIRKTGRWRSLEHVELATAEWVEWWTAGVCTAQSGDVPPAEYDADLHRQRAAAEAA